MVQPAVEVPFTPVAKSVIAVAGDGTLALIHEPTRLVLVGLPRCAMIGEVGIDPAATSYEAMWLGAPLRVLVMSRFAAHSTLHLLDPRGPHGPRTLAEIRLEAPMRLVAAVGAHALAIGSLGAAVITAGESHMTPYQFPARMVPSVAGTAGAQFMVALAGAIEEWDPVSRMPKRRMRLPRPAVIKALGGSDRIVWMATQDDPVRIDCMPLVNRGQPRVHELPEAIEVIAAHPRSDLIACLGAESGKVYIVDLDGRTRMQTLVVEGDARVDAVALVVARGVSALVSRAGKPLAVIAIGPGSPTGVGGKDADASARIATSPAEPDATPAAGAIVAAAVEPPLADSPASEVPPVSTPALPLDRLSAWRDARPRGDAPAGEPPPTPPAPPSPTSPPSASSSALSPSSLPSPSSPLSSSPSSWRDDLVAWVHGVLAGSLEPGAPIAPPLAQMLARFELPAPLGPALALLYGAHLCGEPGVAPVDLARILSRRWDEALGRGALAVRGVAVYAASRIRLSPGVQRALDELRPLTGTLIGAPSPTVTLLGPCVVVATGPLAPIAEACLPSVGGAILVSHFDAAPHDLFVEARAFGAIPLLHAGDPDAITSEPTIFVVPDDGTADSLALPRLA